MGVESWNSGKIYLGIAYLLKVLGFTHEVFNFMPSLWRFNSDTTDDTTLTGLK